MSLPSPSPTRRFGQLLRCSNKDALEQREQDTMALLMEQHDHHVVPKAVSSPLPTPSPHRPRPPPYYETTTAAVSAEGIAMWEIAHQIRVLTAQLEAAQRHSAHAPQQPFLDQTLRDVYKSLAAYTTTTLPNNNQRDGSVPSIETAPLRSVLPLGAHQPSGSHGSVKSRTSKSRRRDAEQVPVAPPVDSTRKKVHVVIAPSPTLNRKVNHTARTVTCGSPRKSTQHAEKTPRHSNVTNHGPLPTTAAPVAPVPLPPPPVSVMQQRPTHHHPSTTEVILTATTTVTPPAVEVTMSSHKTRTLSDVEASLSLLERTIHQQKQPPPTTVQTRWATATKQPRNNAATVRRSGTPGRPRCLSHQSEKVDTSRDHSESTLKEPARRRTSTPGRVRGRHSIAVNDGSTVSREKQHSTQAGSTTPEPRLGPSISPSSPPSSDPLHHTEDVITTTTKRPGLRSKSAGRHRLVRVIASAGPPRSSSVGRSQPREASSPLTSASHRIEFITFENAKRVNTMTARDDSVGLQLQRRRPTVKDDEENSHDRRLSLTRPVAADNRSSNSPSWQFPAESSKTLWNRILGSPLSPLDAKQLEDIRYLDHIVMGTMTSSAQSQIPLLSTSSSSTYRGLTHNTQVTTGKVSADASTTSNAENRPYGEAHLPVSASKYAAPSDTSAAPRKKVTGILSQNNDSPQKQTLKYRSMMNDFEKGIEIFPQDKSTTTDLEVVPCFSEMSSSMSRYDPDVLRHRASMSERLRRQQRKIEKLQRELNQSHQQRRDVVPPSPTPSNNGAAEMVRSRGLDERRRTQAMLEMLDAYTSLWNSNGECESEESVLRDLPIRQRTTSSKRSQRAKLIIRE